MTLVLYSTRESLDDLFVSLPHACFLPPVCSVSLCRSEWRSISPIYWMSLVSFPQWLPICSLPLSNSPSSPDLGHSSPMWYCSVSLMFVFLFSSVSVVIVLLVYLLKFSYHTFLHFIGEVICC